MFKVIERDWFINLNGTHFVRISLRKTNAVNKNETGMPVDVYVL